MMNKKYFKNYEINISKLVFKNIVPKIIFLPYYRITGITVLPHRIELFNLLFIIKLI